MTGVFGLPRQGRSGQSASPPTWKDHWRLHLECISFPFFFFFVSGNSATLLNVMCNVGPYLNEDTNSLYFHMWQNQSEAGKQLFPWKTRSIIKSTAHLSPKVSCFLGHLVNGNVEWVPLLLPSSLLKKQNFRFREKCSR